MTKSYLKITWLLYQFFTGNFGRFSSGIGVDSIPIWGWNHNGQAAGGDPATPEKTAARKCLFEVQGLTMGQGTCTLYGACRYQGQDYMYQVGGRGTHLWQPSCN